MPLQQQMNSLETSQSQHTTQASHASGQVPSYADTVYYCTILFAINSLVCLYRNSTLSTLCLRCTKKLVVHYGWNCCANNAVFYYITFLCQEIKNTHTHTHTHRVEGKICIYCTCAGIMSESRVQVILTNTFFIGRRKYIEAAIAQSL
jgi:hypothetical protein